MKSLFSGKKRYVAGVIAGTLLAGGVAYSISASFWVSPPGSGTGNIAAGSALAETTAAATVTANLYPGLNGDLDIVFSNPNPYPVDVTGVTFPASLTSGNTTTSGCTFTQAALSWTGGTAPSFASGSATTTGTGSYPASYVSVPAKSGGNNGTSANDAFTGAVHMGNSDTACQGMTATIAITSITAVADAGIS